MPVPPVCYLPDGSITATAAPPAAVFPGSFDPLHRGHRRLAEVAARVLGVPVAFEISNANVDKPPLTDGDIARRVAQFRGLGPVWVTRAATFAEKAAIFPGAAFVLGYDTAIRLVDVRYYDGDPDKRDAALRCLTGRVLIVGGRIDAAGAFRVWDAAGEFCELFRPLTEAEFREDVSATTLRAATSG